MADPIAGAIAFSALGANLLAKGLLLLLNPGSRAVHWYVAFLSALSLWLLSLGTAAVAGADAGLPATGFAIAVVLMPVLFLASAIASDHALPGRAPWLAAGIGLALAPLAVAAFHGRLPAAGAISLAWLVAGWGGGTVVHWRAHLRRPFRDERHRRAYRLVLGLLLLAPPTVIGGYLLEWEEFFTYVMPLGTIAIHFIIFLGVARLRFYDIEVRVARSGEIASRAGELERLAAVGELAASVAHEVRNPLTGIRSLAQRMAEEPLDPERLRRYASVVVEEASRLDRIVTSLLSLARRGTLGAWSGEPTRLASLFDDLLLLTAARAARAGVTVRAERTTIVAPAPREALAQALLNLLLNALAHTPRGGTVTLSASDGDRVTISVRDTGPGVPPAERSRIFEPFYTASVDGTGLGLSVVRRIARELDWELEVDDAPGGGAEFRIRLPAAPASRGPDARAARGALHAEASRGLASDRADAASPMGAPSP